MTHGSPVADVGTAHPDGAGRHPGPRLAAAPSGLTRPGEDTPLRVVHPQREVDLVAAEAAATQFLRSLGVDLDTESTRQTPRRMAAAYAEMFSPRPFELTTFPNDQGYDQLVLARSIPVQSVCEHHLLPFLGVAHVGYLPGDRILGLSKLARVVEMFARRPQVQERLTQQVADWLQAELEPRGVGVVIEAEHLCMSMRGVRSAGTTTVTSAVHGLLRDNPATRAEFLALAGSSATTHDGLAGHLPVALGTPTSNDEEEQET